MRPRVFPAEDQERHPLSDEYHEGFNEAAGIPRGRRGRLRVARQRPAGASMRPRVFPAEDDSELKYKVHGIDASMRPRVFPAEDAAQWLWNAAMLALQ